MLRRFVSRAPIVPLLTPGHGATYRLTSTPEACARYTSWPNFFSALTERWPFYDNPLAAGVTHGRPIPAEPPFVPLLFPMDAEDAAKRPRGVHGAI